MNPALLKHFDSYRHSARRRQSTDKLAARAREAAFLRSVGEACPMKWFANSPLYWNLLTVDSDYQPPYLRPAKVCAPAQGDLFQ